MERILDPLPSTLQVGLLVNKNYKQEMISMTTPQVPRKFRNFAIQLQCSAIALVLMSICPLRALAQTGHEHATITAEQKSQRGALVRAVREATARFQAENAGYRLEFGCVSGDDFGAMGLHYVNDTLVGNGIIDVSRPQIVLYEAQPDGSVKLTGADYLVIASSWDAAHPGVSPQLMGQIFHYFAAPNRFGLPAFYTLHVWAWKDNPDGAFVNWHPNVSCQSFVGETTP